MMTIEHFKGNGSDLDIQIETLVAKRLREGTLSDDDKMCLDRLVAQRAGRMIPARRGLRALRFA